MKGDELYISRKEISKKTIQMNNLSFFSENWGTVSNPKHLYDSFCFSPLGQNLDWKEMIFIKGNDVGSN